MRKECCIFFAVLEAGEALDAAQLACTNDKQSDKQEAAKED
jgi:hypothetical protein